MSDANMLVFLSVVMLVGSFLAGSVPLMVNLSEERLNLVSILGAGLLVGTALVVIIPEGTQMLYSQQLEEIKQKYEHVKGTANIPHEDTDHHEEGLHSVIGLALVLGFVFMLLIDQIGTSKSRDPEGGTVRSSRSFQATLGLVVHAAADGIALGAAATTSHAATEMIVFLAIMLHKAPASFGLVTFLLHDGLDRARIRRYLLVFSLAAPLAALATYFGLSQKSKETLSTVNATGFAMLFSAGTFLYVSTVHVLPEIVMRSGGHSHHPPSDGADKIGFTRCELLVLVSGALLPLALTAFHHH
uniref:EOG090X0EEU n=1 Tax=Daphnia sinensis TaxID=1820382 RepID=A0A4Y7NAP4_9CRUS|nr:EOG090X0EEU [Daphnia sinensis]SVE90171.1 EOG090X0EEU [Daphnia sinensis]SVE90798.1 EOG090X0EEU [Daphnia sinensis]SVE91426.1 EOG090X0EEU [Daphnia sinensis]SVE92049.1 EOG090X0EEU [Daphnia sinensis]